MTKIFKINIYCAFILFAFSLPFCVSASTIYIDTNHTEFFVGDTILINVRIDTEDKNINTVEGKVLMNLPSKAIAISDINISGSTFSLWPRKPSLSVNEDSISFVGGVPGGFTSSGAVLFKVLINLNKTGRLVFTPTDIAAYLNDGKGTKDTIKVKSLVINVKTKTGATQSFSDSVVSSSQDKTPPESFQILVAQEGSVFDGKKFLSFNAVDKQTEVEYYEVVEGNFPPVRSGNTYVLQDQDKQSKITVTAYDTSGNARKVVFNPGKSYSSILLFSLIIVIVVLVLLWKRKSKKNK